MSALHKAEAVRAAVEVVVAQAVAAQAAVELLLRRATCLPNQQVSVADAAVAA